MEGGQGELYQILDDCWIGGKLLALLPSVSSRSNDSTLVKDFINQDKARNITALEELLPDDVINDILAVPLPIDDKQDDSLVWPHSSTGLVTVNSTFSFMADYGDTNATHEWIWNIKCAEHIKLFIWKVTKNGMLTNAERLRRGLTDDPTYPRCGFGEETLGHLFIQCSVAKDCWRSAKPPPTFNSSNHLPIPLWIESFCSGKRGN